MSEQLVIEPARFAREGRQLQGTLALGSLPRLAGVVQAANEGVVYAVRGYVTLKGHAALHLRVSASVHLSCQRCLERLAQRLESERNIVLVPGADQFAQPDGEAEFEDVIPEVPRLDVRELVEDELLLAMPLAPHHEEGMCWAPALEASSFSAESGMAESPFSALRKLKKD
jgi:uncharacterized protein